MKWSIKIGKLFGIDVYLHTTFLLLLGFIGLSHWMQTRELAAAPAGKWFTALQAAEFPKLKQPAPAPRSLPLIPHGCVRSRMDNRQPDHQAETSVVR